jgi:hypothetical protein
MCRYMHLIFNLIFQLVLGLPLEMVHKWWRVGTVYCLGVIAGKPLQYSGTAVLRHHSTQAPQYSGTAVLRHRSTQHCSTQAPQYSGTIILRH